MARIDGFHRGPHFMQIASSHPLPSTLPIPVANTSANSDSRADAAPLERRIAQLRSEVATLARGGERGFRAVAARLPRATTLRGRMNELNVERERLEAQLEAHRPDASRAARNLERSVHAELKREASIARNARS